MKIITWILLCLLFVLMTLYPVGALIAASLGYTFELIKISAIALVIAVFSIAAFILERVNKNIPESMALRALLSVLAPLSFINAALYIWACPQIWIILSLFSSAACCIYLVVKYVKPRALKVSALILPGIMTLPLLWISFFGFFFGNIGKNTVVQTIYSPNEAYYAQLIDSDQGALGGATIVDVHEKGGINTFIFKTEKKAHRIYSGRWGEFEDMQIYWKDEECLVINSVEYTLN